MLEALNMQLDPVRTVLTNEVNQITVCVDRKRTSGVFYTVISITASEVRRRIAYLIATTGLFTNNNDFIGSFTSGEASNLVFL